jgi:hypothetical protein
MKDSITKKIGADAHEHTPSNFQLRLWGWCGLVEGSTRLYGAKNYQLVMKTQSRQSTKRFSSRWNWDSPTPLAAGECAPPPFDTGGRAHSLAAKGVGESQFQRGDIHCGALYI